MAKKLIWSRQSRTQLRAIDQPTALRILHTLARLLATGEGDVERLRDVEPPTFRLRVGDYRLRFFDHGESMEILLARKMKMAEPTQHSRFLSTPLRDSPSPITNMKKHGFCVLSLL
jgi:mRNA-degrading endonuclease RelE of RelBE toxin-antitoxin system